VKSYLDFYPSFLRQALDSAGQGSVTGRDRVVEAGSTILTQGQSRRRSDV